VVNLRAYLICNLLASELEGVILSAESLFVESLVDKMEMQNQQGYKIKGLGFQDCMQTDILIMLFVKLSCFIRN
jgi:hypothetical protein